MKERSVAWRREVLCGVEKCCVAVKKCCVEERSVVWRVGNMVTLIARHREPPSQQAIQDGGEGGDRREEIVASAAADQNERRMGFPPHQPLYFPPTHTWEAIAPW